MAVDKTNTGPEGEIPQPVKTEVESHIAEGRMHEGNWRHMVLDIADKFEIPFERVEQFARKALHR